MSAIGSWKLSINTPMGTQTPTLTIEQDGDGYSGTMAGEMGKAALEAVGVDGNTVTFSAEIDSPMGKVKLSTTGTVDGDSMSGNVSTPMGEMAFTGERA